MAVEIRIKQKGLFKKAITLELIHTLFNNHVLLGSRDFNSAYVFQELQDNNIGGVNLVAVDHRQIGRGFILSKDEKDLRLSLNVPATQQDVENFFDCIQAACNLLKARTFILDEEKEINLDGLEEFKQDIHAWNNNYLYEQVAHLHKEQMIFVVFGGYNPIYVPLVTLNHWAELSESELVNVFEQYLHQKQSDDLYYMKPMFYQNQEGEILGAYTLTLGVSSIVPKEAFIPAITSGLPEGVEPSLWQLGLVVLSENEEPTINHIDYSAFAEVISQLNLEEYDENHYILREPTQALFDALIK